MAEPFAVSATYWPVVGLALKATSETVRMLAAPTPGTTVPDCHAGSASYALTPPPELAQAAS